jgi:uncharacterized membrane protein
MAIRNPIEWTKDQLRLTALAVGTISHAGHHEGEKEGAAAPPQVRHISVADLGEALIAGFEDFAAWRSDVIFICLLYPVAGLVLTRLAFGYDMVPLIFPLASGFALIGPVAGLGLYEMSRCREKGIRTGWPGPWGFVRSPSFGAIAALALLLFAIFAVWLLAAAGIYRVTLGPEPPASIAAFLRDVLTTTRGWVMIALGCGVGFLFAVIVLSISVVSFPLLLDRDVDTGTAIATSLRAVARNPGPMALWGLIVAGGLVVGSIPLLLGLIFVMPVLGHATWHLYRRTVL